MICAAGWKRIAVVMRSSTPHCPGSLSIFIEVALTRGMSERIQPLIDPQAPIIDPDSADSAMFYSITNCQQGLRGVPFGTR